MAIDSPLVSVATITFNHEKYIGDCINSVLRQTMPDLELVVVDDGSSDDTSRCIDSFTDPRITHIRQTNQGPSSALNRAIGACRGQYIAIMSGDDLCHPDRLAAQLEAHRQLGRGLVLSNMDYIDDDGKAVESCYVPRDCYLQPQMSRAQVFRKLFDGNFLAIATAFADAESMRNTPPFDPMLYQAQDYDWLIRFAKHNDFFFMPRSTVRYRARNGNANLSAPSPAKVVRTHNEMYLIFKRFFDDVSPELFREAFRDRLSNPEECTLLEMACEQAFLLLKHPNFPLVRLIGMEKLHELLLSANGADLLQSRFDLSRTEYAKELLHLDSINHLSKYRTSLFIDVGNGYADALFVNETANHYGADFNLTFDLPSKPFAREIAWKIAHFQLCRCKLERVTWTDPMGASHDLDLSLLWANGRLEADGSYVFEHLDPKYIFPVGCQIERLTLRGRWQFQEADASLHQTNARLMEVTGLLSDSKCRVRSLENRLAAMERELIDMRENYEQTEYQMRELRSSWLWRGVMKFNSLVGGRQGKRAG